MRHVSRRPLGLGVLGLTLLLTACGVTSEQPLSDASDSRIDERLIGVWEGGTMPKDGETVRMFVGRSRNEANALEAASVTLKDDGYLEVLHVHARAVRLGEQDYLSVWGLEDEEGYRLLRYLLPTPDTLQLLLPDPDLVADAVRTEALTGKLHEKAAQGDQPATVDLVELTTPTPTLRAWVQANGARVFTQGEGLRFRRVGGPSTEHGAEEEDHAEGGE